MNNSHSNKRTVPASKRFKNVQSQASNGSTINSSPMHTDSSSSSQLSAPSSSSSSSNSHTFNPSTICQMDTANMQKTLDQLDNVQLADIAGAIDRLKAVAFAIFGDRLAQGKVSPEIDMDQPDHIARHFGHLFNRLKIKCSANAMSSEPNERIIADSCTKLSHMVFDAPKGDLLHSTACEYNTVLAVTVVHGTLNASSRHMPKWFTQLQRLTLHSLNVSDAILFDCQFPHLEEFTLVDIGLELAVTLDDKVSLLIKLLKQHPRMRKLVLHNVLSIDYKTVEEISTSLPCLQTVHLTIDHCDFRGKELPKISFPNLKQLNLATFGYERISKLPISSHCLKILHLRGVNVKESACIDEIVANHRLTELVLIECELHMDGLLRIASLDSLKFFTMQFDQHAAIWTPAELAEFLLFKYRSRRSPAWNQMVQFINVAEGFKKTVSICSSLYDIESKWAIALYADCVQFMALAPDGTL